MASVKFTKGWFRLHHWNSLFNSLIVSSNPLLRKSWYEIQTREYRINWEIYTPYAGAAGMLLLRNGKFTIGKLKSSLLSLSFVFYLPSLSISRCNSRYDAGNRVTLLQRINVILWGKTRVLSIRGSLMTTAISLISIRPQSIQHFKILVNQL